MTKLQATQLWALFAKTNGIYSVVYMDIILPRSPPNLAMKDLVLVQVVLFDHPACTKNKNTTSAEINNVPIAATDTGLRNGAKDGVRKQRETYRINGFRVC